MAGGGIIFLLEESKGGSESISEQTRQKKDAVPGSHSASVSCSSLRGLSTVSLGQERLESIYKSPEASLNI